MLLRDVTWGTLRAIRARGEESHWITSDDQLLDPRMMQESLDKLDDEPVYRYDPREAHVPGSIKYVLTVAKGYVVALARHDTATGSVTYRRNKQWSLDKPPQMPVSGTINVTENAVQLWDRRKGRISVRAFANTNLDLDLDDPD